LTLKGFIRIQKMLKLYLFLTTLRTYYKSQNNFRHKENVSLSLERYVWEANLRALTVKALKPQTDMTKIESIDIFAMYVASLLVCWLVLFLKLQSFRLKNGFLLV
jgi:hypothetical protein